MTLSNIFKKQLKTHISLWGLVFSKIVFHNAVNKNGRNFFLSKNSEKLKQFKCNVKTNHKIKAPMTYGISLTTLFHGQNRL